MGDMCECGRTVVARGLCKRCHERGRYNGTLAKLPPVTYVPQVIARMRAWERDPFDMCEVSWAAGLFEGEGTFMTNGKINNLYPRAALTTTDLDVIEHFAAVVRVGKIYVNTRRTVTGKIAYRWVASGPQVDAIAVLLRPWLGARRRQRAIDILRGWRTRAGDIGRPLRKIEFEPMPDDVPVEEPSPRLPDPAPGRVPVPVPVPERAPA